MTTRNVHAHGHAHAREHELMLEAALAGDIESSDARLLERLHSCEECHTRYQELIAVRALLDDAGRDERDTLAAINYDREVPGSDRVAPFVRAMVAQRQARRTSWNRRTLAWAASAAAGIVAVGWLVRWLMPRAEGPNEVMLGASQGDEMTPNKAVREYEQLRWSLSVPPGGHCELRIWDVTHAGAPQLLVTKTALHASQWPDPPESTTSWPDKIRWEVRVFDATGTQIGAPHVANAARLPH
jgi:hypothetical protein